MKFTIQECINKSDCSLAELAKDVRINAEETIRAVNSLNCPIPRYCSSFIRSIGKQIQIYKDKAKRKEYPFLDGIFIRSKVPMGSLHLTGEAIDVADPDGKLKQWVKENISALERAGLYCEDFAYTPTWVHFQTCPPKSKKRFFLP